MPDGLWQFVTGGSAQPSESTENYDAHCREKSCLLMTWARQCAERAEQFRREGRVPLAMLQLERCVHFLRQALTLSSRNLSARCFHVGCLMLLGEFEAAKEQAVETMREVYDEQHATLQEPFLHLAIAHIASRLGQSEDAIAFAQRASNEYPQHPQPCATVCRTLDRAGRHFAAMNMARMAVERDKQPGCPARLSDSSRQAALECLGEGGSQHVPHVTRGVLTLQGLAKGLFEEMPQANSPPSTASTSSSRSDASAWAAALKRHSAWQTLEEVHLGIHEVLELLPVMLKPLSTSETVDYVSAGKRVRVLAVALDEEEHCVWGRIRQPQGWITVGAGTGGKGGTKKEEASPSSPPGSPRARLLPFGPSASQEVNGSPGSSAMGDLERIFSGVMPAASTVALHGEKEQTGQFAVMVPADKCSRCCACCNCRKGGQ
mmetsp:Transcript_22414/g.52349  ORF Transcript_22414/g.52349 Transcript_22414/m.52349 type:complete len:433 (+) Transcript_22414:43-1341(+)